MKTEILYTTRNLRPQPTPAPAKAPALAPNRITIGWGISGRLHLNRSKAPETYRQQKPKREVEERNRSSMSAESRPIPLAEPREWVERVDRSSRLERVRRPKPFWEELAEQKNNFRALEYLAVSKVAENEYTISELETGEIFVDQAFETRQHCYEAAAELEQVFDMAQVLELKLTETLDRVEEIVEWHYLKEWVALGLV